MTADENKAIVQRVYVEMDLRKTAPEELYDDNFTLVFNGSSPMDREGAKQFATMFYAAFPDLTHTVKELVVEGDKVAAHVVARGTHQGELMGIPPTGRRIEVQALGIYHIARGRVIQQEGVFDQITMLQQLGVAPMPEANAV